ncbi:MAG: tail fiber domain-containing protein [Elusimicrobia bacterium]|nr:tail fiber domain-containing protein [Elusimicrobiota bacterium]
MRRFLAVALLALPCGAWAQTRASGDLTVTGAMGAGTTVPRAALEIRLQASDAYALKASSADGTAMFLLDRSAKAGLGLTPTGARLDASGQADSAEVGLELRAGNSTSSVTSAQAAFGDMSGARRHNIRSRATGEQRAGNALDFYLWTSSDAVYALGSEAVMSLQLGTAAAMAGWHVDPSTEPATVELVVSSGAVYAGGVILRSGTSAHSCFAALKDDVRRFGDAERAQAAAELRGLRPASFRYKGEPEGTKRVGFIYEEVPESLRGPGGSVSVNARLMNLELALQAAQSRITTLQAEVERREKGRAR